MKSDVKERRIRRQRRKRFKMDITKPILTVFRSNRSIYAQIIDKMNGKVLCSADDRKIVDKNRLDKSFECGCDIAKKAIFNGITKCIVDIKWYKYHGRVAKLIDGARKEGLIV